MRYRLPDGRVVTEVANYGYLIAYRTDTGEIGQCNAMLAKPLDKTGEVVQMFKPEPKPEPQEAKQKSIYYINKAVAGDLAALPGVTRRTASRILTLRPEEGFKDLDDLKTRTATLMVDWDTISSEVEMSFDALN